MHCPDIRALNIQTLSLELLIRRHRYIALRCLARNKQLRQMLDWILVVKIKSKTCEGWPYIFWGCMNTLPKMFSFSSSWCPCGNTQRSGQTTNDHYKCVIDLGLLKSRQMPGTMPPRLCVLELSWIAGCLVSIKTFGVVSYVTLFLII